jgi:hypothetical protein
LMHFRVPNPAMSVTLSVPSGRRASRDVARRLQRQGCFPAPPLQGRRPI